MKVIIQIGYKQSLGKRKDGQSVKAYVNDMECSWNDKSGKYLTSKSDSSKGLLWYAWSGDLNTSDVIKIVSKTWLIGIGPDEKRTFESIYYVDESAPLIEVSVPGVGYDKYPLLKGRILEIASVSEDDKRRDDISSFISEGF